MSSAPGAESESSLPPSAMILDRMAKMETMLADLTNKSEASSKQTRAEIDALKERAMGAEMALEEEKTSRAAETTELRERLGEAEALIAAVKKRFVVLSSKKMLRSIFIILSKRCS